MNLQELNQIWNDSDLSQEQVFSVNQHLLKEVSTQKIKSQLYEVRWTAYFELIVGLFWVLFLIRFAADNFGALQFALPALILLGISLFNMILSSTQLGMLYAIRPENSIIETQQRLEQIKYIEEFSKRSLYVIIPLFSTPFLIVAAKAFLGINLYTVATWLTSYAIGSIVIGIIVVFLLRRFPNKNLQESINFLKDLKE